MPPDITYPIDNDIAYTNVNGTKGTLNHMDAFTLIEHAKKLPDGGKYLETGSYLGCSALLVALHSGATVWAHDIWVTDWSELKGSRPPPEVKDYFYEFYDAVKKNGLENRVIPIRGNSIYTVGIHDDETIDLAFVDGDHSYEGCIGDLEAVLRKMKKTGTILAHDCIPDSAPLKAVTDFVNKHGFNFNIIAGSWGMARITL
jgi:predicted O-methyltransferase YrrM